MFSTFCVTPASFPPRKRKKYIFPLLRYNSFATLIKTQRNRVDFCPYFCCILLW
jgi:hypothetical protein